ncbi:protection of telomeres protein 1-like [Antedon mediterranea]|uniref:protection of telomeres protein 1-like n=1 Tax=Antedon mediterranea TaxID=105859 RepID=UPI003AF74D9D
MAKFKLLDSDSEFVFPSQAKQICIGDITSLTSLQNMYIKAVVETKYNLVIMPNYKRLKAILEDCKSKDKITVFLFGEYAAHFEKVKVKCEVVIFNAKLEKSTTFKTDKLHAFRLNIKPTDVPLADIQARPPKLVNQTQNASTSAAVSNTTNTKSPVKEYMYTPLADLQQGMIANVYGVVSYFKPPFRARGTDYCLSMRVIDKSLSNDGLSCTLFMRDKESLPHVLSIGDVVRMHRLKIQMYKDALQAVKHPGFASLVFSGEKGTGYKPRSSTPLYTMTKDDEKKVDELRKWKNVGEEGRCLSSIKGSEYLDISVQIVAKVAIPSINCIALKVWDGSLFNSSLRWVDTDEHDFTWDTDLAEKAKGYVVDVWVYDDHVESVSNVKVGQFITIKNLHVVNFETNDTYEIVVHGGTKFGRGVISIPEDHPAVSRMKRLFNTAEERRQESGMNGDGLSLKQKRQRGFVTTSSMQELDHEAGQNDVCMQESATIISGHYEIKVKTIKDVLEKKIPNLSKIRAKVINFEPSAVNEFVQLVCPKCKQRAKLPTVEKIEQGQFKEWQKSMLLMLAEGRVENEASTSTPKKASDHQNKQIKFECPKCTREKEAGPLMHYSYSFKLIFYDCTDKIEVIVKNEAAAAFLNLDTSVSVENLIRKKEMLETIMTHLCPMKLKTASEEHLKGIIQEDERPWLDCCIKGNLFRRKESGQMRYQLCDTLLVLDDFN